MSGDRLVARRIAELTDDVAVKKCLQELFMHEWENQDQLVPRYKTEYEGAIARHAAGWEDAAVPGGSGS